MKMALFTSLLLLQPLVAAGHDVAGTVLPQSACASPAQSVKESGFVALGGIEQWVSIRGARCGNPVVLFLHGGPGNPLSPYAEAIYGAWEKDFTLVQWDQRGAGKTFSRNPSTAETTLTIEQMATDGVELASYLAAHLRQPKVILMGGSWGSALGVHMVKARPEAFTAYVGSGQLVASQSNEAASYAKTLALVRAAADTKSLEVMTSLGAPPWSNPRAFGQLRRITRAYEAKTTTPAPKMWWAPSAEYESPGMEAEYEAGEEYSYLQFVGPKGDGIYSRLDLNRLGSTFEVPVYLVQGAEDLVTTPGVARAYFDSIKAPHKEFILLPATGHDPNVAMVEAQHEILRKIVRASD